MSEASANPESSAAPRDPRTRIVEALLELAAERQWEDITLSDVAERAGVTLSQFRDCFPSKGAALAGFSRMIDKKVLDESSADLANESARDRLFDVLMRRLDAMAPYKEGVRGIAEWARRDPVSALALNGVALNSMRFMLEAAGLDSEGPLRGVLQRDIGLVWKQVPRQRGLARLTRPRDGQHRKRLGQSPERGGKLSFNHGSFYTD